MAPQKHLLTLFLVCFCILCHAQGTIAVENTRPGIISAMPLVFTENGLGFGGSYERAIDKKGIVAFYMPVIITFNVANSNRIYNYSTGAYTTGKPDALGYTMPGIKWYPTGCYSKLNYAAGLSLVIADGQKSTNLADLNGLNITENVQSHFLVGGMLQNSLNMNEGKNLCLGIEIGLGCSFINNVGNVKQDNEFLIQGSFKIGYRL